MKFAYVICFVHPTNKEPPSFMHTFVEAANDDDAYWQAHGQPETAAAIAEFPDRPWNDYVFPVGDEL